MAHQFEQVNGDVAKHHDVGMDFGAKGYEHKTPSTSSWWSFQRCSALSECLIIITTNKKISAIPSKTKAASTVAKGLVETGVKYFKGAFLTVARVPQSGG
jgi:hypothetical protein